MRRIQLVLSILLIIFLLSLVVVDVAFAQGEDDDRGSSGDLLVQFAPIIAATVAIERLLQLVRNLVSPDPDKGLLARTVEGKTNPVLRYYATIGGIVLGLIMVLLSSDLRLLDLADIKVNPIVDLVVTAVTIGMGTEFVHEVIKVLAEGKRALRLR